MRHRRLALIVPLAGMVGVACFSSNNGEPTDDGGPDGLVVDAAPDTATPEGATPEASTPDQMAEAAPMEASLDAPVEATVEASVDAPVEAAPPVLSVVVGGPNGYESGVPVVWHDSTGAVVATATTDGTGAAITTLSNVTMATALLGTTINPAPYTVMGLQLGETVVVADVLGLLDSGANVVTTFTAVPTTPTLGMDSEPLQYLALTGGACSGNTSTTIPFEFNEHAYCVGVAPIGSSFGAAFPALVEADSENTGLPLGFAYQNNNSFDALADAGGLDLDLSGMSWSTDITKQIFVLPIGSDTGTLAYSEVANGTLVSLPVNPQPAVTDAGTVPEYNLYTHVGFASQVQVEELTTPTFQAAVVVATSAPAPTTNATVPFDPTVGNSAPTIQNASTDWTSSAQPVVSWTLASGTLASSTAIVALSGWYSQLDGGQNQFGTWTIVSPGVAGATITAPSLPSAFAAFGPQPGASGQTTTLIAIDGHTAFPTYSSFLPTASLFQQDGNICSFNAPFFPPMAGVGTAVASVYTDGGGC